MKTMEIKLSKKQKEVIKAIRSGEVLLVDERSVFLSKGKIAERLNLRVFFNLVKKGVIFQDIDRNWDWYLTTKGKTIEL